MERLCNAELKKISSWFKANGLTLHPEKTKIMLFNKQKDLKVKLDGVNVTQCGSKYKEKTINILGIHWDEKLSWTEHVKNVIKKVSGGLYLLKKFKNRLNSNAKKLIYESLIRSHLLYGLELWGNNKSIQMNKLNTLQKKAIRIIGNRFHTSPIMKNHKILSLRDEYNVALSVLAWSTIRNMIPVSIKNDYNWVNQRTGLRNITRVEEYLYRSNNLKNQLYQNLARRINEFNEMHINFSKNRYKKLLRDEKIDSYSDNVRCNNITCRDCN